MRVAVTGAAGQLGRALVARLGPRLAWAGGRDELDVREAAAVAGMVERVRPDVVINAAAFNDVDGAESDPAPALAVNAAAARHLARACRDRGALLVHVSSDYVFDGAKREPYREEDCPRPLNVYGVSKLAGCLLVSAAGGEHLIVRTSGVFGAGGSRAKGGAFVERILARARQGAPLRVVDDQVFAPTYAADLAEALLALVDGGARGLVHVTNSGTCSWHELATAALDIAGVRVRVEAIRSRDLGAPARRPAYSVLAHDRARAFGLPPLRSWRDALAEFLRGGV
ncbi:MAG: dTDP-4-dehydrorhamnose reductase [Acidobacteria bacterium]|nr:MAG: dTDP-4-dehydrorhamnose reductase [Acidobacteriota bacterium]